MLDHPVLPLFLGAALVAFLPRRLATVVMLAAPVAALARALTLDPDASIPFSFFGYELELLRFDDLSRPFTYVFCAVIFLAALFGSDTMTRGERIAALLSGACGLGVVLAGDLLTLFVMWEAKAVITAVLIALGGSAASGPAAYRYLVFHVAGGAALLGGILWHLSLGGSLTFDQFASHPSATLVLVAFMLSAAVPPLHPWLPDAYPAASIAGTVFLSAFTTKAAVYALLRGFPGTEALVVLGVAMALYGVVFAVLENDLRRLLSYHIVSQVGFMVAAVGIGTAAAVNGATAHAFAHILYKGLLMMGVGALIHITAKERLTDLGGLARATPLLLGLYMVGALSISGLPLLSGFVSKELVIDAAYGDGRQLVVYLLKLASVGTFLSTALKLPWLAWGGRDRGIATKAVPATMIAAMVVAAGANVLIGLRPDILYGVMPNPVDYQPFAAAKISETVQLLLFTGLGFWMLSKKFAGEPTITLDTDWIYRRGIPRAMAAAQIDWQPRLAGIRERSSILPRRADLPLFADLLPSKERARAAPSPTVALGAVMMAALVVVLAVSVIP